MDKLFVGVEIGASKHQIYLMNSEFSVLKKDFGYVEIEKGAAGILEWMKEHIALLIEDCKDKVAAISVGFGGIIETATGTSVVSVQVDGWKDFNIVEWFEKTFGIKSFVLKLIPLTGLQVLRKQSSPNSRIFLIAIFISS